MRNASLAGFWYFAIVFAAGFLLGTLRVLYVIPHLGETGAVLIELPLMLVISWIACGALLRRMSIPQHAGLRLVMGGVAFVLLMLAEMALAWFVLSRTPEAFIQSFASPNGAIGLVGQIAYALFPMVRN
ncbi:MAG TPA: hypothetical protein VHT51_01410 [Micropepsaceae bacterium]|jgi:hypothetical protein|nr:hypothetical protein [Micropepsaceae bacterium]